MKYVMPRSGRMRRHVLPIIFIGLLMVFSLFLPLQARAQSPVIHCQGTIDNWVAYGYYRTGDCSCATGRPVCRKSSGSSKKSPSRSKSGSLSTNNQIKKQLLQGILDEVMRGSENNVSSQQQEEAHRQQQEKAQRQHQLQRAQKERELEFERQKNFDEKKDQLLGNLKGPSTGTLGLKLLPEPSDGSGATPFFGSTMPVSPESDADVVDLRGKKGIVDPNDPSLGYGKIPEGRKIAPTTTEIINSLNTLAKQQGWSEEKIKHLNKALHNLDLANRDYLVGTDTEVTKVWDDVEARSLDKILAGDLSQGHGPILPVGAGEQSHEDCTIFALANAARLPYGVVAAQATDIIREAGYRSAGEKADPQKTIEAKGLNGGEVTMLAETFGRAEVVPPAAFADTLKQGKPVLVALAYPTRDPNKDPLALHEVVLTKTFLHKGARWYEMMNSQQGPLERQYLSEKELRAILSANGVAYSPEPGTVVKPIR